MPGFQAEGLAAFPAHPVSLSAAAGEALAERRWPRPGDHGAGTAEALRTGTACPLPPCQGTQPQTSPQAVSLCFLLGNTI